MIVNIEKRKRKKKQKQKARRWVMEKPYRERIFKYM